MATLFPTASKPAPAAVTPVPSAKPVPVVPEQFAARLQALEVLVKNHVTRVDGLALIPHNFEQRLTGLEGAFRDQTANIIERAKILAAKTPKAAAAPASKGAKAALFPVKAK